MEFFVFSLKNYSEKKELGLAVTDTDVFSGPSEWSISVAEWGGSFEAVAAGAQGLSSDQPTEEDRLSRWDFFNLTTVKMCVTSFWCNRPLVFRLLLRSRRREHERHIRAHRFSRSCNPTQLVGPQPLCRAKRPELQSSSWSHGCAGRDGSAAEGWEWTVSHYHGCTVSVCRQMMSNASQPRIRGKKRTVDCPYNLSSVGTPRWLTYPIFPWQCSSALAETPVAPSCCGLELSSSLLGMDWDVWESFLLTLP